MGNPNYLATLQYKEEGGTFASLAGIKSITIETPRDSFDITRFNTNAGYRQRMKGLKDYSLGLEGDWLADASQTAVRALHNHADADKVIYIRYLYDGTNGFDYKCVIGSISGPSGGVGDLPSTSISLEGAGEVTAVP